MTDATDADSPTRCVRALANTMAYIAKYPNHINGAYHVDRTAITVLTSSA